jgi:KDO2-lipid IV(A) lauroyltransferase
MLVYCIGWKFLGYRKSVIIQNLSKSFPEKKYKEINQLANQYFKHLSRLFAEWLKSLSENRSSVLSRISFENTELLDKSGDLFIIMGHYGNWEAINCLPAACSKPVYAVYKEQSSPLASYLSLKMRCRFGIKLLESNQAARFILKNKTPSIYILITDQSPSPSSKTKLQFMNQPTLVFEGFERLILAKKGSVVYAEVMPEKNTKYSVTFTDINTNANITSGVFSNLEQTIRKNPQYWLWSHRRWKHVVSFMMLLT